MTPGPGEFPLLRRAQELAPDLMRLRHDLHRYPEIGLDLPRTQAAVLEALDGLGLEIRTGRRCSSVVAVLRGRRAASGAPRRAVLLRADLDALPVHEDVDLPYRSQVDGAMHACGHDLHTAMLAGAARLLVDQRDELPGDVVLMFQPGEEGYDGAGLMIEEGVLDAAGRTADAAYALHVFSGQQPSGSVTTRSGPIMAASDGLHVTVRGRGGHGSAPHLARDPVPAACEMVLALQTALTRTVDAQVPAVLTVGVLNAGTKRNVIPATATFEATIRTFDPAVGDLLADTCRRVCEGIAAAHGVEVDVRYTREYPVTVNDPAAADDALAVGRAVRPDATARLPQPIMGSEDFSRVLARVPGAMVFLGACAPGRDPLEAPANHSAQAAFDDDVLPIGAALYAGFALRALDAPLR